MYHQKRYKRSSHSLSRRETRVTQIYIYTQHTHAHTYAHTHTQVEPVSCSIFGHYTFLTTQTNLICTFYFACCCLKDVSDLARNITYDYFALAFGLGTFLTIAYYALDHYNPESIKRRKYWIRHGYPYCGLNGHLVHFGALPLSLLHMVSIRPGPSFEGIWYIAAYMTFFVCFSMYNRLSTGKWQYPVLEDVQRSAGFVGCLIFIFVLSLIVGILGYMGTACAQHFSGVRRSF